MKGLITILIMAMLFVTSGYGRLLGLDDRYVVVSLIGGNDFEDDSQGLGWTECYRYAILQKDTIGTGNEKWKQSTKSIRCQPVRYIVIIIRC